MKSYSLPAEVLKQALDSLQTAGRTQREGIVLLLSSWGVSDGSVEIREAYTPHHLAEEDRFWIPPQGIKAMMAHLRSRRYSVAGQIHTHPGRAFHSAADDLWAIPSKVGALSIVLPRFAAGLTAANTLGRAAVYQLSTGGTWDRLNKLLVSAVIEVTP